MEADQAADETIARCVSLIVYYRNCGRAAQAREIMEADAAMIAGWLNGAGLSPEAVERRILGPILSQLSERYPIPESAELYREFVAALYLREPEPSGEHLAYQSW